VGSGDLLELEPATTADQGQVFDGDMEDDPPRRPRRAAVAVVYVALCATVALGVLALFFSLFAFGLSGVQEHRSQYILRAQMRGLLDPSSAVAPFIAGAIPAGSPVALLRAPQVGLDDLVVVEGTTSAQMVLGPGHLPDSPLPGQVGQSILIGRSSTSGAPFATVGHLHRGTVIQVVTGQGAFRYRVMDKRVAGGSLPAIPPSGSILTLVTSVGPGVLGPITDGHLVYVDLALRGQAVPTLKGRPTAVSPASIQGASDLTALPGLVAWMVVLLAGLLGALWLLARWGWRRCWLIIAPVSLGILWGLSNQLLRLVPNVY